jgi:CheY-like chemotaxis protein
VDALRIVAVVTDLMLRSRIEEQAHRVGYELVVADSGEGLLDAVSNGPSVMIIDLHATGIDWRAALATAKEQEVPVLAFGRHTETELLRSARAAGCERVVPRSQLVAELPELIDEVVAAAKARP